MPFFVRPMVKRGYKKRTGRSLEEWKAAATGLVRRLESADETVTQAGVVGPDAELTKDLGRLAENFRTAPDRAARGMRAAPATLELLRKSMKRREQSVRDLIEAIYALPE
jgi:hypothetical protein